MDFPVCPSCRQSVIDDDAVDCPFCGASMKAKPGAKASPKPAAAAPAKGTAAAPKAGAAKPATTKPTLPGDDLPFESELTAGATAIPALPSPTKQRTLKVICPMCDTPGYLPPSAAGKDVRCANAKCVMPVFTAPAEKKEAPPPPPAPPKPSKLPLIGGITLAVVLLFGVGLYFAFFSTGKPKTKELTEEEKQLIAEMAAGGSAKLPTKGTSPANVGPITGQKNPKTKDQNQAAALGASRDELINSVLKQMKDSSLASDRQRSKPFCRQLAAEANAVTGNPGAASEHLDQLVKVGSAVTYYRIIPLLDLFWADFAAGDKKAATTRLNNALSEVPKIPKFGRTRLEIVGRLIAAQVAAGRIPDALNMLSTFQSSESEAQLAARLQIAMDGRVSRLSDAFFILPWEFPQAVAATASLLNRGEMDAAIAWASAQKTDEAKAECLAIWAEHIARTTASKGEVDPNGVIAKAIEGLPPSFAARVWARAGCGRVLAKDQEGAAAAVKLALEKLSTVTPPPEPTMPNVKNTQRFARDLPPPDPLIQAAIAATQIAFVQAQSADTVADAEQSLDLALTYIRATAPTFAAAQQRQEETDRMGNTGLQSFLKSELRLKSDDEARTTASNYKRALAEIVRAAEQKLQTETTLLSRLCGAGVGLYHKVWVVVSTRSTADDVNRRENLFATQLPGELIEGLKGTPEEKAILGAWGLRSNQPVPPRPPFIEFNELLKTDVNRAVQFVQTIDNRNSRREDILLRTASLLPTMDNLPLAFQFISKLDDMVIREECYRLAAALGAQNGQADLIWSQISQVPQNTEKTSLCRGLIAGLVSSQKSEAEFPEPSPGS
ncbi:hypothetical protein [Schlesneria sp. T3-172]|uniref:hypothetical protein n=2 Tax=Schlesneria TaxID=656899 RepID=UPI0037C6F474